MNVIHRQNYPMIPTGRRRYTLHATAEYGPGLTDYWGGNSRRWESDAGCLFAHVGPDSTIHAVVQELKDSFFDSGEFMEFPEVEGSDLLVTLVDGWLTDEGREQYGAGKLFDCAADLQLTFQQDPWTKVVPSMGSMSTGVAWEGADDGTKQEWLDNTELPQVVVLLEVTWLDPPIEIQQVLPCSTVEWVDRYKKVHRCTVTDITPAKDPREGTNAAVYLANDNAPDGDGAHNSYDLEAGKFVLGREHRVDSESWWLVESPLNAAFPGNETEWMADVGRYLLRKVKFSDMAGKLPTSPDVLTKIDVVQGLQWLLDDMEAAGECRTEDGKPLFDSVEYAGRALKEIGGSPPFKLPKKTQDEQGD